MKKMRIISGIVFKCMLFILPILTLAACGTGQGQTAGKSDQTANTKARPDPPEMDIFTASLMGNLEVIQGHIQAGTDLDQKDPYGSTPLIIAATFGKKEVAMALIEGGADLNLTNGDGATPLHSAAFLCRTEIVKALLENGADKTIKNNTGHTAFEIVAGPFGDVKGVYDAFGAELQPVGLRLDYDRIKTARPKIAEMLK